MPACTHYHILFIPFVTEDLLLLIEPDKLIYIYYSTHIGGLVGTKETVVGTKETVGLAIVGEIVGLEETVGLEVSS